MIHGWAGSVRFVRDTPVDPPGLDSVSSSVASQGISWGGAHSDAARLMSGLPRDLVLGSEGSGTITPYEVCSPAPYHGSPFRDRPGPKRRRFLHNLFISTADMPACAVHGAQRLGGFGNVTTCNVLARTSLHERCIALVLA